MFFKQRVFFTGVLTSFFVAFFTHQLIAGWLPPIELPISPPADINSLSGYQDPSGNTIVTWMQPHPPPGNYLNSIYLYGEKSWSPIQIQTSALGVNTVPSTAINASGKAVAAWLQGGSPNTILVNKHSSSGSAYFTPLYTSSLRM